MQFPIAINALDKHSKGLLNKLTPVYKKTILSETYCSIHLKHNFEKPIISAQ